MDCYMMMLSTLTRLLVDHDTELKNLIQEHEKTITEHIEKANSLKGIAKNDQGVSIRLLMGFYV